MMKLLKKYIALKVTILMTLIVIIFASATITIKPKPAQAICCASCCWCVSTLVNDVNGWFQDWIQINAYLWLQLQIHRVEFIDLNFWQLKMLPLFMQMANQFAAIGSQQVMIIGMFLDAKEQLETQRLLQELHARASKDYYTSIGMCEFGTRIKSLVSSERKGEMNSLILSERSLDRLLGNKSTGASFGQKSDIQIRFRAFQEKYCDTYDNNNSLKTLCPKNDLSTNPSVARKERFNNDIDYQRTIENPWTIGFDYTGGGVPSSSDEDILAMSNNLYGFDSFNRADYIKIGNSNVNASDLQKAYLRMRAAVAKTKVAENSFNALMALKGEGTAGSRAFIVSYLEELGIDSANVDEFLGTNPSYYAQMDILTKKAYQSPLFYTRLYDKPANVERKGVALQAIGMIQKFDLLKSNLRTEASLSILLELEVEKLQREVEDNIEAVSDNL